jgi:uncharacterized membrane protein YgcG
MSKFAIVTSVLALAVVLPCTSLAQAELPGTDDKCINDHAEVVRKGDLRKIKKWCKKASRGKIEMMVVTIDSLDDFQPRPLSVDRFADTIFNDWDTGYDEAADAIMVFISVKENEFRLLLGDNYPDRLRKKAIRIIRNKLVPAFRRRRRSAGIRKVYSALYFDVVKPHIRALKQAELKRRSKRRVTDFDQ